MVRLRKNFFQQFMTQLRAAQDDREEYQDSTQVLVNGGGQRNDRCPDVYVYNRGSLLI